ncbi:E3 ubiquitin-protein ligase RSL1 [Impatiens glandulifera]|uniref:E3 ubiquitin-protein ligase RSL1 n=1 Tax=Impatiens glandulifera TaxID=253017 RepID=UPI001FB11CC4|nr:E3 ubiquitin-protein ligase RSL1 [Impatiens glandulifera]XP_047327083.1 E3 ubiquitin-protein ligase RSL1 [Impatiens glandulifera]
MEGREGYSLSAAMEMKVEEEEDEDEFRSCCEDESELKERELKDNLDGFSVKMFFKGVSITKGKDFGSGLSGIGVVMEKEPNVPYIQVQKKLEFYVDNHVAEYLALIDGLLEALKKNIKRVFAFTDSETLYNQLMLDGGIENPLLLAMRVRVFEHARNLESFVVKLVDKIEIERPLHLAQVAIGIICSSSSKDEKSVQTCSICCEEIPSQMMFTITCSHKFCTHCMKTYVDDNIQSGQLPIRCPQLRCKHYISSMECGSFLTVDSFESLKKAFADANIQDDDNFYCPYEDCSALFGFHEYLLKDTRFSSQADNNYLECPDCCRAICIECRLPWHSSMTCEELQNLTTVTSDNDNSISRDRRWRRCQECLQVIEHNHGSYHITCRCGHEFCYSCGDEYRNGLQTCECAVWDEEETSDAVTDDGITDDAVREEYERWAWDSFDFLPTIMDDAYTEQERSQLRLIQRFLAGGFTLGDHQPSYESSPPACTEESSYVDPLKDLHQLPWLERFVSVITDDYSEEYMQ